MVYFKYLIFTFLKFQIQFIIFMNLFISKINNFQFLYFLKCLLLNFIILSMHLNFKFHRLFIIKYFKNPSLSFRARFSIFIYDYLFAKLTLFIKKNPIIYFLLAFLKFSTFWLVFFTFRKIIIFFVKFLLLFNYYKA